MDDIKYTSPEDQIAKLKSQNLIINNEKLALSALSIYGYSNLIKSYREPYIVTEGNRKIYRSSVSFEQIYSLYILDKNLRNAVMAAMLDLEEYIKEQAADVIAQSFGTYQGDYLKYRNYQNKRKRKQRFTLAGLLNTIHNTLKTDKDPIHHYLTEHGIVPPWILFKSIYFSTTVNFIDQFKKPEQIKLLHKLYDINKLGLTEEQARTLMIDTLYICLDYRNTAAHGGRIYNFNSHKKLRISQIWGSDDVIEARGFSQILSLLSLLKYKAPIQRLSDVLNNEVNRHCNNFPQDVTYLGQILNLDIITRNLVFTSEKSNKYHSSPYCSGMKNAQPIELEQAQTNGLIPCSRCMNK